MLSFVQSEQVLSFVQSERVPSFVQTQVRQSLGHARSMSMLVKAIVKDVSALEPGPLLSDASRPSVCGLVPSRLLSCLHGGGLHGG